MISVERAKELIVDWTHEMLVEIEAHLGIHPNRRPAPAPAPEPEPTAVEEPAPAPTEESPAGASDASQAPSPAAGSPATDATPALPGCDHCTVKVFDDGSAVHAVDCPESPNAVILPPTQEEADGA